jgi:hypothetical protein
MMPQVPNFLTRPYRSVVPQAIDALTQAWQAAFAAQLAAGGERVYVRGGPWTAEESGGPWAQDMAVAWYGFYPGYQFPSRSMSEELGDAVVSAHNDQTGLGASQEETFTIGCASMCLYGGEASTANWSTIRAKVYGNVATAAASFADPAIGGLYLGGVVQKIVIGSENALHQVPSRRGILAIVTFQVDCVSTSQQ